MYCDKEYEPVLGYECQTREIMSQQRLDYVNHCSLYQFSYVHAHDEPKPKNTQQARTIDCIYI